MDDVALFSLSREFENIKNWLKELHVMTRKFIHYFMLTAYPFDEVDRSENA